MEMCLSRDMSISFSQKFKSHSFLFGEDQSRYIVTVNNDNIKAFEKKLNSFEIQYIKVGRISRGNSVQFADNSFINLDELKKQNKL